MLGGQDEESEFEDFFGDLDELEPQERLELHLQKESRSPSKMVDELALPADSAQKASLVNCKQTYISNVEEDALDPINEAFKVLMGDKKKESNIEHPSTITEAGEAKISKPTQQNDETITGNNAQSEYLKDLQRLESLIQSKLTPAPLNYDSDKLSTSVILSTIIGIVTPLDKSATTKIQNLSKSLREEALEPVPQVQRKVYTAEKFEWVNSEAAESLSMLDRDIDTGVINVKPSWIQKGRDIWLVGLENIFCEHVKSEAIPASQIQHKISQIKDEKLIEIREENVIMAMEGKKRWDGSGKVKERDGKYLEIWIKLPHLSNRVTLWKAVVCENPGAESSLFILMMKELCPRIFNSIKRHLSTKQLNDIDRYVKEFKLPKVPVGPTSNGTKLTFHSKRIDTNTSSYQEGTASSKQSFKRHRTFHELKQVSSLGISEILRNITELAASQPQLLKCGLSDLTKRIDYYFYEEGCRNMINLISRVVAIHLKRLQHMKYHLLRLRLKQDHFKTLLRIENQKCQEYSSKVICIEYPELENLIFAEQVNLISIVLHDELSKHTLASLVHLLGTTSPLDKLRVVKTQATKQSMHVEPKVDSFKPSFTKMIPEGKAQQTSEAFYSSSSIRKHTPVPVPIGQQTNNPNKLGLEFDTQAENNYQKEYKHSIKTVHRIQVDSGHDKLSKRGYYQSDSDSESHNIRASNLEKEAPTRQSPKKTCTQIVISLSSESEEDLDSNELRDQVNPLPESMGRLFAQEESQTGREENSNFDSGGNQNRSRNEGAKLYEGRNQSKIKKYKEAYNQNDELEMHEEEQDDDIVEENSQDFDHCTRNVDDSMLEVRKAFSLFDRMLEDAADEVEDEDKKNISQDDSVNDSSDVLKEMYEPKIKIAKKTASRSHATGNQRAKPNHGVQRDELGIDKLKKNYQSMHKPRSVSPTPSTMTTDYFAHLDNMLQE